MKFRPTLAVALCPLISCSAVHQADAQGMCRAPAPGVVPGCGVAPGYFRPQGQTLTPYFIPQPVAPQYLYAPVQPNGRNWQQYNSGDPYGNPYGPVEPNPYGADGRISIPRAADHVWTTRIRPRLPY